MWERLDIDARPTLSHEMSPTVLVAISSRRSAQSVERDLMFVRLHAEKRCGAGVCRETIRLSPRTRESSRAGAFHDAVMPSVDARDNAR